MIYEINEAKAINTQKMFFRNKNNIKKIYLIQLDNNYWKTVTKRLNPKNYTTRVFTCVFTHHSLANTLSMFIDMNEWENNEKE